jgi:nitrogen fixation protein FixH
MTVPPNRRSRRWPWAIVGLLVLHAGAMIGVIVFAGRDPSFAVEPNSYQQALAWDATMAERRASESLGWKHSIALSPRLAADGRRDLECRLTDRDGAPVSDAKVELVVIPHAAARERARILLRETEPGLYFARVAIARPGLWELRLRAQREQATFVATEMQTVGVLP